MNKVLYISLTGMTEPLGRSQVLEYLADLSKKNKIYLISFERENDLENLDELKKLVEKYNIEWCYFIYSNKYGVFSTVYQILQTFLLGFKLVKKHNIEIIHARSFIPTVMGYLIKKLTKAKLLFDVRGFSSDEKVDRNRLKKDTFFYKLHLSLENYMFKKSDHLVTLTHRGKEILTQRFNFKNEHITVIPTCANSEKFKVLDKFKKNEFKKSIGYQPSDIIFIHTGSVGGWYDFEKEVVFIKKMMEKDKNVKFLILNKKEQDFVYDMLSKYNIDKNKYLITSAPFEKINSYLSIADFSIFFIKELYSKNASAPTKFAENVSCLLPSITTSIGDMKYYVEDYNVGFIVELNNFESHLDKLVEKVISFYASGAKFNDSNYQNLFNNHFDKNEAVNRYQNIYDTLRG